MSNKGKPIIPGHSYKVVLGRRQKEKIEDICNKEDKTPNQLLKEEIQDKVKELEDFSSSEEI